MTSRDDLTSTSFALLGQLALRPWSGYEMTRNITRTLHWFWPRAESVLYDEVKRLAAIGLAETHEAPGRRGRPMSIYSITPAGLAALREWLTTDAGASSLHSPVLLRVHLAPYGTRDDLVRSLTEAKEQGEAMLRQATEIGLEFAEKRHQFQDQVHLRAILFDYLWSYGLGIYLWATRWLEVTADWDDLEPIDDRLESGRRSIETTLREAPHLG